MVNIKNKATNTIFIYIGFIFIFLAAFAINIDREDIAILILKKIITCRRKKNILTLAYE